MLRTSSYCLLSLLLLPLWAMSTHNRAGDITYEHLYGNTYRFTIFTCTKSSVEADRPELAIRYGDGTGDTLPRQSITALPNDAQKNIYIGVHTYTGPGTFFIQVEDPNRNADVLNIQGSVNQPFCIESMLTISPFLGDNNNSVQFDDCPCPEHACTNKPYYYNSGAFDPDGDSLSYSLVPCRGEDCIEFAMNAVFTFPDQVGGGVMSIDPVTGTLSWISPSTTGEYNVAILVKEWRGGVLIGSVLRDVQILVFPCSNNPPNVEELQDTCVQANSLIDRYIEATDMDAGSAGFIDLTATSEIFNLPNNPGVFIDSSGMNLVRGRFIWQPGCTEVRDSYYQVVIRAEDNSQEVPLRDIEVWNIKVNAPPPDTTIIATAGTTADITWSAHPCGNVLHYNVYRAGDSILVGQQCCENGAAENAGYVKIAEVPAGDTSYFDNTLSVGNRYCYVITATLSTGGESCVGEPVCTFIDFVVPTITQATVVSTDLVTGSDSVVWSWPRDLDTSTLSGPFFYELYRNNGFTGASTLIHTTPSSPYLAAADTVFWDQNIDTDTDPHVYQVVLYNNGVNIGSSPEASTIYLTTQPSDDQVTLTWQFNVPWFNTEYTIYRETPTGSGVYTAIGMINATSFVDTNVVNGQQYCYKVRSLGGFAHASLPDTTYNFSQVTCEVPFDDVAPCPPLLNVSPDCDALTNTLNWSNPNLICADDVTAYNIYYSPALDDTLLYVATVSPATTTTFVHQLDVSLAGCYYVTALDSAQYGNESVPSNVICVDNCDGLYELPNVFTPNGNGINDVFHPILPYKFVHSIEMTIFNRWGDVVFETVDPMINWDGTHKDKGEKVSPGVYFYTIKVNELKLEGIQSRTFQGNITVMYKEP